MAINYNLVRAKVNDLNRMITNLVDMLNLYERGTIIDEVVPLTPAQITILDEHVENQAENIETLAEEIKNLVKE